MSRSTTDAFAAAVGPGRGRPDDLAAPVRTAAGEARVRALLAGMGAVDNNTLASLKTRLRAVLATLKDDADMIDQRPLLSDLADGTARYFAGWGAADRHQDASARALEILGIVAGRADFDVHKARWLAEREPACRRELVAELQRRPPQRFLDDMKLLAKTDPQMAARSRQQLPSIVRLVTSGSRGATGALAVYLLRGREREYLADLLNIPAGAVTAGQTETVRDRDYWSRRLRISKDVQDSAHEQARERVISELSGMTQPPASSC